MIRSAIVTGASSGIGEAFARKLASRSVDLLLTALPSEDARLREIARELAEQHQVRVEVVTMDLAEPGAAARLKGAADALGFEPDTLVNNAGHGVPGKFAMAELEQHVRTIRLNVETVAALTALYAPGMVAKGNGTVINVASTSGLAPIPYFAVYAASKAFVLSFSQALWAEYRRQGLRVVAACPGPVQTGFQERAYGRPGPSYILKASDVVDATFKALERDRPMVIQRVWPLGAVLAFLSAPILPLRVRLLVGERIARWVYFRE
jgi:short-subunit dehydrogenase